MRSEQRPHGYAAVDRPFVHEARRGHRLLYRFANGYGASVVRHMGSYGYPAGLWELGVIVWNDGKWSLTYQTPITDDVLGWLTEDEVATHLAAIEALPPC